eukprot:CAMPEP_0119486988 /NCGR_PEP_ID=MMETSP1344-20130328/13211_1 /TAXON_ID=236787 /ORGANISM="Florenciella parvula, Strain CCMP2471" /LENGTH=355 /DNA_ID=CAMNT_0007521799 /DNA_START=59 /DNA_END=1123 /DNA_ORIENTATION=+
MASTARKNGGGSGSDLLDKKLRKALDLRTDAPAMVEALDSISGFYGENTLEARRGLRHELEHQNVLLATQFIEAFTPLNDRLVEVDSVVGHLEQSCVAVSDRLRNAETAMIQFTERAADLQKQRDEMLVQADEVSAFLSHYTLTPHEVHALQTVDLDQGASPHHQLGQMPPMPPMPPPGGHVGGLESVGPVGPVQFFAALERLQQVRLECQRLVGSRHQSAAFELLETLSQQQEQAYDKIYHWVQKRCGVTESEKGANNVAEAESIDDVDGSGVLKHAIHALRARPGFYVHCQESLGSHRRMLLVQRFVAALTVGGVGGTPRPIELQAHDPVRYVGDMVAWVHQAVASEKELLTS